MKASPMKNHPKIDTTETAGASRMTYIANVKLLDEDTIQELEEKTHQADNLGELWDKIRENTEDPGRNVIDITIYRDPIPDA